LKPEHSGRTHAGEIVSRSEFEDHDASALDQALGRLRQPTTVKDRLDVLKELVNFWHGPIKPEDGMGNIDQAGGVPLPLPLRFWFGWAGKRADIMTGQNILFRPRDYEHKQRILAVKDGHLHFYVENQGVYEWSTLSEGDDPPVFGRYGCKGRWTRENVTLSEHLIMACLFEAIMCHARHGASAAWLTEEQLGTVVADIPPLAIAPWRWTSTRFFVGRGIFVCAADYRKADGKQYCSAWLGAKTEKPLQFLRPLLDNSWDRVEI
jgi:hypothetical protein